MQQDITKPSVAFLCAFITLSAVPYGVLAEDPAISVGTTIYDRALAWLGVIILVALSGLFSGLTLGLMAMDIHALEVVTGGKDEALARAAKTIIPVRRNGNLLLCTLLFGNVAVISMTSIIMADLTSGLIGFFSSTIAIVLFGEIFPQALCSRYALQIGARAVPLVKLIVLALYPFAKPVALFLDLVLGEELGAIHTKEELGKLLEIHVREGAVDLETGNAIQGALRYKEIAVEEAMTTIDQVFMLANGETLSYKTMARIFKAGYSRIPIYNGQDRDDIVGLLLVKDLIFVDPSDDLPVSIFMKHFGRRVVQITPYGTCLDQVLQQFREGRSHMAIVGKVDPENGKIHQVKGIVTLEDVLELMLGMQIKDETDHARDQEAEEKRKTIAATASPFSASCSSNSQQQSQPSSSSHQVTSSKCFVKMYQTLRTARMKANELCQQPIVPVHHHDASEEVPTTGSVVEVDNKEQQEISVVVEAAVAAKEEEFVMFAARAAAAAADNIDEEEEEEEEDDQPSVLPLETSATTILFPTIASSSTTTSRQVLPSPFPSPPRPSPFSWRALSEDGGGGGIVYDDEEEEKKEQVREGGDGAMTLSITMPLSPQGGGAPASPLPIHHQPACCHMQMVEKEEGQTEEEEEEDDEDTIVLGATEYSTAFLAALESSPRSTRSARACACSACLDYHHRPYRQNGKVDAACKNSRGGDKQEKKEGSHIAIDLSYHS